jgi:NADH:ubiquinone oxidoreductase subunit 2 (subunit N)
MNEFGTNQLVLLPEALVLVVTLGLSLAKFLPIRIQLGMPPVAAAVILAALALELWLGAKLATFAGGAYMQDRFALAGKAVLLLSLFILLLMAGWVKEKTQLPLACLVALAGMVAVSVTSLPWLWVSVVGAALAGGLAGPARSSRWTVGGVVGATGLLAGVGFVWLGVQLHGTSFASLQRAVPGALGPALSLAAMLAASGVLAPLVLLPIQTWTAQDDPPLASRGESAFQEAVLGSLVTATSTLVAAKVLAPLLAAGSEWGLYIAVLAALGAAAGGLAALAATSLRALAAWMITAQASWVVGSLAAHSQMGSAAAVYLLGGLVVPAAAAPLLAAELKGPRALLAGFARRQPWRWIGLSLALASLAGVPPLAGFFGEFAVAIALLQAHLAWVLAAGLLGGAVATWAVVRVLALAWLEPEEGVRRLPDQGWRLAAGLMAVVVAGYGLLAYPIYGLAIQSAEALGFFR